MSGAERERPNEHEENHLRLYQWSILYGEQKAWYTNDLAQYSREYIPEYLLEVAGGDESSNQLLKTFIRSGERKKQEIDKIARKGVSLKRREGGIHIFPYEKGVSVVSQEVGSSVFIPVGLLVFTRFGDITTEKHRKILNITLQETNRLLKVFDKPLLPPLPK